MIEHRAREQAAVEIAALAVGPEEPMRMGEGADLLLGAVELCIGRVRRHQPEWQRVAPGVIADPVSLGMRALRECAAPGPRQFLADHEERRFHTAPLEYV